MARKPKLTTEGQLNHLKEKGVLFTVDSEDRALEYLVKNNNYFKLRSYRTNYGKRSDGTYVDLEFAYLRDLAIIDMIFNQSLTINISQAERCVLHLEISALAKALEIVNLAMIASDKLLHFCSSIVFLFKAKGC